MNIQANLKEVLSKVPESVRLVAVSKFHPKECILSAYESGQRIFGESKVQELQDKYEALPKDIEWHFIGHLQTNKVKYIVPYISLIHAVDSFKLLTEINKQAIKVNRCIPCLLEIHIAQEDSKYGFSMDSCKNMLNNCDWQSLNNISISGVMGMATNTEDATQIRHEFEALSLFFNELKEKYFRNSPDFKEISMGMSHDYQLAIEAGSTLVRVGSYIFGNRNY